MYRLTLKNVKDVWRVKSIDVMVDNFLCQRRTNFDDFDEYFRRNWVYDWQEHYFDDFDLVIQCAKHVIDATVEQDALNKLKTVKKQASMATVINVLNFLKQEGVKTKIIAIDNGYFVNYYYYRPTNDELYGIYLDYHNHAMECQSLTAESRSKKLAFNKNRYCTYYTRDEIAKRSNVNRKFTLKITT